MIDVTFLLLVYFMVATEFKLGEEVYPMDLPDRRPARQERDPFELDERPLRIQLASTGPRSCRIRIDGPYAQPATFSELFDFLRQRRISDDVSGGLFEAEHPIILEPTRTTRWQHAMDAFNAVARARYTNVTFGAVGQGD
jgi:biopolymer transport protein ExbD